VGGLSSDKAQLAFDGTPLFGVDYYPNDYTNSDFDAHAQIGNGGTLMGVGRALKEHNPNVKIVAAAPHPDDKVQGLRSIEHGFIPPILDLDALDGRIMVEGEEAFYWTRRLLTDAGVFVGVSSGATFGTAHKLATRMSKNGESGKIVAMFADGGWKYLSTGIYNQDFKFNQKEIEGKTWW